MKGPRFAWMLLIAGGITGATSVQALAQSVQAPCNVPVGAPDSGQWQMVLAEGFTFCLPPDWAPVGDDPYTGVRSRVWQGDTGTIGWGHGDYRPLRLPFQVEAIPGSPSPSPRPIPQAEADDIVIQMDGRIVEIREIRVGSTVMSGAIWPFAGIYLSGNAEDDITRVILHQVYRTVRIVEQTSGPI